MKVLIVRVGAMGDVLHALPAVSALRHARPDWQIDWAVSNRWAPLLVNSEAHGSMVNHVHLVDTRLWSKSPFSVTTLKSVRALRAAIREQTYDIVVDMQGTLRSAVIGRFAGAKVFAGYADPRESMAAWMYPQKFARRGMHVVDQGAALLGEACRIALEPMPFPLPNEDWSDNWAEQDAVLSRPTCLLGVGAGWGAKRWPAERFGKLAIDLRAMGYDVIVNGSRKEDALPNSVVAASDGAARLVVCNVTGLVALMRRTDLFIGGDSGPTHMAAALAVPTVALFGPTDPERNGPWGPGPKVVLRDPAAVTSYKRTSETGLAGIAVESVVEAVRAFDLRQ
jgi:heptosyltransferase-1